MKTILILSLLLIVGCSSSDVTVPDHPVDIGQQWHFEIPQLGDTDKVEWEIKFVDDVDGVGDVFVNVDIGRPGYKIRARAVTVGGYRGDWVVPMLVYDE